MAMHILQTINEAIAFFELQPTYAYSTKNETSSLRIYILNNSWHLFGKQLARMKIYRIGFSEVVNLDYLTC